MKRLMVSILLFVILISCVAAGVDLDSLTSQQRQEYLLNSLSIDVGSQTMGSSISSAYATSSTTAVAIGSSFSSTSIVWTPFYGGNEISKVDFFELVGDKISYEKAKDYQTAMIYNKKMRDTFLYTGLGVSTFGCILMMMPIFKNDFSDSSMSQFLWGTGIAIAGCGVMCFALPFEAKLNQNLNISAQYAIGLADSYNYELYQKITMGVRY